MIPGSRRNLFSFSRSYNAGIKAGKAHASGAQHAKEEDGRGGGAHREWCSVGGRGTVVGVCLVPEGGVSLE